MQKNWYVIYTRPGAEKKVASVLNKKKIEIFFPLQSRETNSFRKPKVYQEPLFKSYVFARVEASEIEKLKAVKGIVNLLYWKGKVAIINQEEIDEIKGFLENYQDIRIEKTTVKINDVAKVLNTFKNSFNGNILTVKNTMVSVNLSSFGFTLKAKVETADSLESGAVFQQKNLLPS
jgi:transcription antitermination factor NusG